MKQILGRAHRPPMPEGALPFMNGQMTSKSYITKGLPPKYAFYSSLKQDSVLYDEEHDPNIPKDTLLAELQFGTHKRCKFNGATHLGLK